MQTLTTLKDKGQESLNHLVDLGKQQPEQVRTWGITAAAAVAGSLVLAATAQGLLAVMATIAAPPVALTIGAIGGGLASWSFIQSKKNADVTTQPTDLLTVTAPSTMTADLPPSEMLPVEPMVTTDSLSAS